MYSCYSFKSTLALFGNVGSSPPIPPPPNPSTLFKTKKCHPYNISALENFGINAVLDYSSEPAALLR